MESVAFIIRGLGAIEYHFHIRIPHGFLKFSSLPRSPIKIKGTLLILYNQIDKGLGGYQIPFSHQNS